VEYFAVLWFYTSNKKYAKNDPDSFSDCPCTPSVYVGFKYQARNELSE
jgi:hypothetical protein